MSYPEHCNLRKAKSAARLHISNISSSSVTDVCLATPNSASTTQACSAICHPTPVSMVKDNNSNVQNTPVEEHVQRNMPLGDITNFTRRSSVTSCKFGRSGAIAEANYAKNASAEASVVQNVRDKRGRLKDVSAIRSNLSPALHSAISEDNSNNVQHKAVEEHVQSRMALGDITNFTERSSITACISGSSGVTVEANGSNNASAESSVAQNICGKRRRLNDVSAIRANLSPALHAAISGDEFEATVIADIDSPTEEIASDDVSYTEYIDEGDPIYQCEYCGAMLWYNERIKSSPTYLRPLFSICCGHGKVVVPHFDSPPETLRKLFFDKDDQCSKNFLSNIRTYNNMFAFTSMGGKINHSINAGGGGPYSFLMGGQNYHLIGSLLPEEGKPPVYSQLYIYDTQNEIHNRIAAVTRNGHNSAISEAIVQDIKDCLDAHNSLVKEYRMAAAILNRNKNANVRICLLRDPNIGSRQYDLPVSSEVAALIEGDFDSSYFKRDIIVEKVSGKMKRVDELHRSYLPLQYPILFPYGNNGYMANTNHAEQTLPTTKKRTRLTIREYLAFHLMDRDFEVSPLLHSKRLLQQFIVDGYSMVESERLDYLRKHQKELRVDLYEGLSNALSRGVTDAAQTGKRVILPSSFTGGARYMMENYQDAMAICAWAGYPDLFLTFTCNPAWPEVKRFCKSKRLNASDRPDILSRIFQLKVEALMKIIKEKKIFGKVKADIYTIEFQKRGLPHAHIILFLDPSDKPKTPEDVDRIISAEIPDKDTDPLLYDLVSRFMIHGPCGQSNRRSPCMKNGKCSKHFPKRYVDQTIVDEDGYPTYRRRNDGRIINKKGIPLDNRFVVPYNAKLLKMFQAHINVEKTNQSRAIKYLFKYISKGSDRVVAAVYTQGDQRFDEISHYMNCRYLSPCEGSWRIFCFDIHNRSPSVERLSFHLQNNHSVVYRCDAQMKSILEKQRIKESMFTSWMEMNKTQPFARTLKYSEFPHYYTFVKKTRTWKLRERGFSIGRLANASPSQGEVYYLRLMLTKIRGPKSYEDIRTVDGIVYKTFREACYAMGLLDDDQEFIDAIKEASRWASGHYLRKFFVSMLLSHCLSDPISVWESTKLHLSEDLLYLGSAQQEYAVTDQDRQDVCLVEIEKLLISNGKSLRDFPPLPAPTGVACLDITNHLISEELNFNRAEYNAQAIKLCGSLNGEQTTIFEKITHSLNSGVGGFFFVHGFGGTGKTFLWNTLTSVVRASGNIVLNVASSGIAATLLPRGRTAHSRFHIPIHINEDSMCNISQNSPQAELLKMTKLIIWDEAPMVNKFCIEALDRTLKDIMKCSLPFGGKSVVMGGDFRQILPVVPKGGRAEIVNSAINSSHLWAHCQMFQLKTNMRLQATNDPSDKKKIEAFSNWLLQIGEGRVGLPHDGISEIEVPNELLITDGGHPIEAIVSSTYPDLMKNMFSDEYLTSRAILSTTMEVVDQVNDNILSKIDGEFVEYFSSDSISKTDQYSSNFREFYDTEFLNSIKCSGIPPHRLRLKVGVPVMLLRNIDQAAGLCNGTRLRITFLGKHFVKAVALNGTSVGQEVLIHRMDMNPSQSKLPFSMNRRQFPFIVSFAMTINKSQGQSLSNVGLFLPNPVFSHGQFYVAISRVKTIGGLKMLILDSERKPTNKTRNVVYLEALQNVI